MSEEQMWAAIGGLLVGAGLHVVLSGMYPIYSKLIAAVSVVVGAVLLSTEVGLVATATLVGIGLIAVIILEW